MGLRSRQRRWACTLQDRSSMSYGVTPQLRAPLQKHGGSAAKIGAGSALALTLGVPPTGLIGEIFELGKKIGGAKIDESVIADAEKTEGDVESAAASILKPKTTSSPPKEIQALRKNFE